MSEITEEIIPDLIELDVEGSMKDCAFFAIYAGLRMYKEQRQKRVPEGQISFSTAEAFSLLEQLKEKYPEAHQQAKAEYEEVYGDVFLRVDLG